MSLTKYTTSKLQQIHSHSLFLIHSPSGNLDLSLAGSIHYYLDIVAVHAHDKAFLFVFCF